jgi:hypothetical protein
MQIVANIEKIRNEIMAGSRSGTDVARMALRAISDGMGSKAWEELMGLYASNSEELNRLCGREPNFNQTQWGMFCLAYIAGDSTCTSETAMETGTLRSMNIVPDREMKELLDDDLA